MRIACGVVALALSGCAMGTGEMNETMPSGGGIATAELRTATGAMVGQATASTVDGGLRILVEARNMAAMRGTHGIHVHMVGRCDAPGFESAGAHWNPSGRMHGSMNPQGPHTGDLPNLIIGTDGSGSVGIDLAGAAMTGFGGLLDADGAAMMIHANADDMRTDPSGNSGGRIACGVFIAN